MPAVFTRGWDKLEGIAWAYPPTESTDTEPRGALSYLTAVRGELVGLSAVLVAAIALGIGALIAGEDDSAAIMLFPAAGSLLAMAFAAVVARRWNRNGH